MRSDKYEPRTLRCRGAVLVLLLAISAIVAVLGGGMLTLGYHSHVRAMRTTQKMAARVAADAGLTRAMHTLSSQFADGSLSSMALPSQSDVNLPNCDAVYTYAVSQNGAGVYVVVSTGACQDAQITVESVMTRAAMVHEYAVFAQGDLLLRNSAIVDWYNGNSGDALLKIGTNSAELDEITLDNGSYINGDVLVGVGGDPDAVIKDLGGSYAGTAYAQSVSHPAPSVVVPDDLASAASQGDIAHNVTIASSGKYDRVNLGNAETLVIDGQVALYVTGSVILGKSARIEIKEGSSLVLYVDGNVEGKVGSQFNNLTKDPRRFKLLGTETCEKVELKNSGDMYTIIYAPQADTALYNSAVIWGAVASKTAKLDKGASLYYDASLTDYQDPLLAVLKLTSWREY